MSPPALAAVLAAGGLPPLRVVLVGVAAVTAGAPAVSAVRGTLDRRLARSGARLELARAARARVGPGWVVALAALSAALALVLSPLCLALYAAAVASALAARLLRAVTAWETVAAGVSVGLAGLAGWAAVAPLAPRVVTVFAFFALWTIGGCAIAEDLANLDRDRSRGVTTVATVHGALAAARAACVLSFAALAATIALPMPGGFVNDLALVVGVVVVAVPGAQLWHRPTSAEAVAFFDRVSLYPAAVLLVALLPAVLRGL
jgi:4-hydroxybenzoate polyprenyltransferase